MSIASACRDRVAAGSAHETAAADRQQGRKLGEFILPLNIPGPASVKRGNDDFSFDAAAWTLTAHEARPGHEMQFAAMVDNGVSQARAIFAFNSTNVEGWGLYAEYIMRPYMPLDGQVISLQHRMMRAARAFLDPELHMGKITPEQARKVLLEDVMLSEAMTNQEVERYTFRSPGQATSYFYGFTRLLQLRTDVEKAMGSRSISRSSTISFWRRDYFLRRCCGRRWSNDFRSRSVTRRGSDPAGEDWPSAPARRRKPSSPPRAAVVRSVRAFPDAPRRG